MDPESLRAAVGRNAERYLRHSDRMQRAGRTWVRGWNWAAFLHSTGWFWYRRLYGWAVLNLIAPLLVLFAFVFAVQWVLPEPSVGEVLGATWIAYAAFVFLVVPAFADSLYLRQFAHPKPPRPPSTGSAIGAFFVMAIPALFAYVAAQAQLEYSHRERLTEGVYAALSVKDQVKEFHAREHRFPSAAEEAQFRHAEPLKYMASVGWDAARGAVVAIAGERYPGGRIEFVPAAGEGALVWTCRGVNLEPKHLPASCR